MRSDEGASAEMEALQVRRLWHAYTRSDRHGPRSPLRRGLLASTLVAALALAGTFLAGVVAAARDDQATKSVPTVPAPTTTATMPPPPDTAPPSSAPPTTAAPAVVTVSVPSTVAWTDANLDVAAGTSVELRTSGEITHDLWSPAGHVGVAGDTRPELGQFNVLDASGARLHGGHGGLIARIGDGPAFVVGSAPSFVAPSSGRLFLGVNDAGLDNNEGAFTVTVTVAASSS